MKTFYSFWLLLLFFSLNSNLNAQNMALDFGASNDYVATASTSTLDMNGTDFTIELWVQSSATFSELVTLIAYRATTWGAGAYQIGGTDSYIKFSINGVISLDANIAWADGTWHHIAATYDNSTHNTRIYFDGIDVANGTSGTAIGSTNQPLYLGAYNAGSDANANIQMDEIRIWKEVRTQAEIRANMLSQLVGNETNLALYYKCDATSGTTLTDATSNNIHGTLYNMTNADWIPSPAFYGPKNCLSFDGSDDYAINTGIAGATGANSFTMEALVYRDPSTATDDFLLVGNSYSGDNARVMLGYNSISSSLVSYYKGTDAGAAETVVIGHELAKGKWYHVAIVYDNATLRFYVDGEDVYYKTGLSLTFVLNSAYNMYIAGPSEYGQLKMDEVRLWSDVRTATEIKDNMYKELVGNEAGLLSYYKMNFNNGTTIPNYSSQGTANDATLTNMDAATVWVKSEAYNNWLNTNSTAWGTAANWATGSVPNSSSTVIIDDLSSDPIVNENPATPATCNNLNMSSDVTLKINAGKALTVGGNLTVPASKGAATLTVESTSSGTGSLIVEGTATGDVAVERLLTNDRWHYISEPVNDTRKFDEFLGLVKTGTGSNIDQFYWWDEDGVDNSNTGTWFDILNATSGVTYSGGSFNPAQGYAINYGVATADQKISFSGVPYTETKSIVISKSAGTTNEGANLVGNPFTSTIALNTNAHLTDNFLKQNATPLNDSYEIVYLWNEQGDWSYPGNDYLPISNSSDAKYAAPGQAFMVVAATNDATINFNQTIQKHGSATFYKDAKQDEVPRFYMSVENDEGLYNEILIAFIEGMTNGLDPSYDAGKLKGNPNIALYTKLVEDNGIDFAHQALPPLDDEVVRVKTGLDVSTAGNYTFKINELQNFDEAISIKLEDKVTGSLIDFRQDGEYSFFINTPGEIRERFVLHFNGVTGIEDDEHITKATVQTYGFNNTLYILNPEMKQGTVTIYNLTGQKVATFKLTGDTKQQQTLNAIDVINVVKIQTGNGVLSQKVIFR